MELRSQMKRLVSNDETSLCFHFFIVQSVMTYLAEYWKVFSADTKVFLATKRLNRAIGRRLTNIGMRDEYLSIAREFAPSDSFVDTQMLP